MSNTATPFMAQGRIAWIDSARALSVLAVVLYHVYVWHFASTEIHVDALAGRLWEGLSRILGSVRMPLLLIVSGILASRRIRNTPGWRGVFRTSLSNYYLYSIWLFIYTLIGLLLVGTASPNTVYGFGDFFKQLVHPDTSLWFIFALAVYAPLLMVVRSVSPAAVVGALLAVNVVAATLTAEPESMLVKIARLFIFFAIGVYFRDQLIALGNKRPAVIAVAGLMIGILLIFFSSVVELGWLHELAYFVRSLALALASVGVIALAVRCSPLSRLGHWVGSRTLSIYVVHPLLVVWWNIFVIELSSPLLSQILQSTWLATFYPLFLTAFFVAFSIAIESVARKLGVSFLFSAPALLVTFFIPGSDRGRFWGFLRADPRPGR